MPHRIGGAIGIAEPAADRRHVDDAAAAGCTQQRDRVPRAEEVAVKIERERAPPVVERQFLRRQGRPGNTGVVDEDIKAAELPLDLGEQRIDLGFVRDIGANRKARAKCRRVFVECRGIDVADHAAGAGLGQSRGDDAADSRSPGRHQRAASIE
jgi:hypothetical protein